MFRSDLSDAEQNDTATKPWWCQNRQWRREITQTESEVIPIHCHTYLSGTERYFNLLVIDTVEVLLSVLLDGLLELRLASLYLFI